MRHPILTLPVHRRSPEKYYSDHDRWVERQKPALEKKWRRPFDEIPAHIKIHWKDRWYWPPWYFNDVLGYVRIGSGEDLAVAADIYLRRQNFDHGAPERLYRDEEGPEERQQVLFLGSTSPQPVVAGDNRSYLKGVRVALREARGVIREFGRGTSTCRISLPGYDLSCIDFAKADAQARQKAG